MTQTKTQNKLSLTELVELTNHAKEWDNCMRDIERFKVYPDGEGVYYIIYTSKLNIFNSDFNIDIFQKLSTVNSNINNFGIKVFRKYEHDYLNISEIELNSDNNNFKDMRQLFINIQDKYVNSVVNNSVIEKNTLSKEEQINLDIINIRVYLNNK